MYYWNFVSWLSVSKQEDFQRVRDLERLEIINRNSFLFNFFHKITMEIEAKKGCQIAETPLLLIVIFFFKFIYIFKHILLLVVCVYSQNNSFNHL